MDKRQIPHCPQVIAEKILFIIGTSAEVWLEDHETFCAARIKSPPNSPQKVIDLRLKDLTKFKVYYMNNTIFK